MPKLHRPILLLLARVIWWLIALPVALFLLLSVLLYVPAVQDFALRKATAALSEATGYEVSASRVRLSFPLGLAVDSVLAREAGDTLLRASRLRLNVQVMPLFRAQANVDGIVLRDAQVDTKSLIGGAHVRGTLGELRAELRGVGWETERVRLQHALVRDADLLVCLSHTAQEDTAQTTARWVVDVYAAELKNVRAKVALPAAAPSDSALADGTHTGAEQVWVMADVRRAVMQNGHFDTGRGDYAFQGFDLKDSSFAYKQNGRDGTWSRRADGTGADYADNMAGLAAWQPLDEPAKGRIDPSDIVLTDVNTRVEGLTYTGDGRLRMNLKDATMREKHSGLAVEGLNGEVYMDNERLRLPEATLRTGNSTLRIGGDIPWSALTDPHGDLTLDVDATLGWQDVERLSRGYVDPALMKHYPHLPLTVKGQLGGNVQHLRFKDLFLKMPDVVTAKATGRLDYLQTRPQGDVTFSAITGPKLPALYRELLPDVTQTVSLPGRMTAKGNVKFQDDNYRFTTEVGTGQGSALATGSVNTQTENFDVNVAARDFPLRSFLPDMALSPFTGQLHASGNAFDPMRRGAKIHARADVKRLAYSDYDLSGIQLDADIAGGKAVANFNAQNPNVQGSGTLRADLGAAGYQGSLDANLSHLDLRGLGVTADTLTTGGRFRANFSADKNLKNIHTDGRLESIHFSTPTHGFRSEDLDFAFTTAGDSTWVRAESGDLVLRAGAKGSLDRLTNRLSRLADEAMKQVERKEIDQEALKRELPPMDLYLSAGPDNPVSSYLNYQGYTFRSAYADLHAHPRTGLNGTAGLSALKTGNLLVDTVHFDIAQDTTGVTLDGFVKNYTKKNPNKFDARLHGYLLSKGGGLEMKFYDSDGEKGIDLGMRADLMEDGVNLTLYPEHPVLAYRDFTINRDNYVFLGDNKQIRANIDLLADDGTGLQVYSAGADADSVNDITVSLSNVNLAELSNVVPYLPKLDGVLTGDFHLLDTHKEVSAMGSLEAQGFAYEGTRLGNLGAEVVYLPKSEGEHYASAYISSNGEEVMEAEGTYYTADDTFDGTAHLHDFPLAMANAFLEGSDLALDGRGGGDLSVKGRLDRPTINGELLLDSAHIYSDAYGFRFGMDEKPIVFNNSRIVFDDYKLRSTGTEPLVVNGNIDMTDLSRMTLDLGMNAKNFELINAKRTRKSMVFGKMFTDFAGTVKGPLDDLSIRGKLDILDKTDVTYILKDSPLTTDNRLDDLVTFMSFTDSVEVEEPTEEKPMNFDLALGINVSDAAHFRCFLSEDGQSYANFDGGGALTFRITPQGDMRLTGKLTAQDGEMKYDLPVIPLRTFKLQEGSTIEFTGDPMNPTLNIRASERMKVLVTEDEQQRAVAFDVGVALTKPLDQMGLEFTINAPEDLSVQNQLAAMSPEQRNKAAVAMMATGMYFTDGGAQTSGFKANNALNAFLQNEIQSIAGNALKTIDVSLGVETGTSLAGTQTTDYSFQFAKRFWDDRIRVIIGGRVSAGKNADNRAESIINNVSVEYKMNRGATRYLRVFYDRDQQDPLEGLLTNTGVGYSVRRKADKFTDLFLFRRKKEHSAPTTVPAAPADSIR